jgi:hypothetical protein
MIRVNPLKVAKQYRHSVQTMLETYAAWLDGTTKSDLKAIEQVTQVDPIPPSPCARDTYRRGLRTHSRLDVPTSRQ